MAQDSDPRRQSLGTLQTKQFCSCTRGSGCCCGVKLPSPLPAPLAQPGEPVRAALCPCPRTRGCPHCSWAGRSSERGCRKALLHQRRHAALLQKKLAFWSSAACVQREERGGEAQTLLQSRCFSSPCAAAALPSLARCRRDVTCASAAFRLPLSLPLLLARCLLGAHDKQQIDGDCTGICLKVHGTHQRMAGVPVLPPSRRCAERPRVLPSPGTASALPPSAAPALPAAPSGLCQSRP